MGMDILDESPCIYYKLSSKVKYPKCLLFIVGIPLHNIHCWKIIVYIFSCMPLMWLKEGVLSIGVYIINIPIQHTHFSHGLILIQIETSKQKKFPYRVYNVFWVFNKVPKILFTVWKLL